MKGTDMRRTILAAACAITLTTWPTAAQETTTFDPTPYIGQGDVFNCADFMSQADAQSVLRADPTDPNGLDRDVDGIACETNKAPKDLVPVAR
jgi:hypothetical protein